MVIENCATKERFLKILSLIIAIFYFSCLEKSYAFDTWSDMVASREWTVVGTDLDWEEANYYCKRLGDGWMMPSHKAGPNVTSTSEIIRLLRSPLVYQLGLINQEGHSDKIYAIWSAHHPSGRGSFCDNDDCGVYWFSKELAVPNLKRELTPVQTQMNGICFRKITK